MEIFIYAMESKNAASGNVKYGRKNVFESHKNHIRETFLNLTLMLFVGFQHVFAGGESNCYFLFLKLPFNIFEYDS